MANPHPDMAQQGNAALPVHSVEKDEERLRLALEAGRMGTWEWVIATDQVMWSPGLEAIYGLTPGTLRGTFDAYLADVHPEDRDRVLQSIRQTLDNGCEHRVEYRLVRPDGSLHWVEGRGKLFFDERGKPARMIGVSIDIDHRKRLEEQLHQQVEQLAEAEARVRSVVDHVIDGIVTIDERGLVQSFNAAAERIFGYFAAEVVGHNVKLLMPEPYHGEHDGYLANYLRTGQAKIIGIGREVVGRRKDGSAFPMYLGVSEFRLDGRRYFTGIIRDVTERKRSERIARFLADASRSLAALVDYESTMQKVARLAVPFFADWCLVHIAGEDGVLRQLAAAHVDPAKAERAAEVGSQLAADPDAPIGVWHVFRSGRSEIAADIRESFFHALVPDPQRREALERLGLKSYICVPLAIREKSLGAMTFISAESGRRYDSIDLAVAEDLAHRAAIAIENARLYAELREADRRKDEFLAMLAHELRSPLAPIRSGLDLLGLGGIEPDTVSVMQQQVQHLVRLVDDLLDVSRIMRGKIRLRREQVDLADVVQRAVEAVRPLVESRRHELAVSLPSAPIHLQADPVRLAQVVTNLLNNSAKYTEDGGRIELSVRQDDDFAVLSVRDNGLGISPDLLPRVFDLFTQADRSLERSQGGLGIGLTLVRRLVEMHGGTVTAQSEGEGRGSEFVVRLPVLAEFARSESPESRTCASPGRRILVVDDNVGTAKILARLFEKLGPHEIEVAYDGLAALEAAARQRPEIILLDIGLPRLNGYEVAHRLRERPEFLRTLLVALTGYGTEEDRRRSVESGFDEHLIKPPSIEQLRQLLAHPKLHSPATV